MIINYNVEMLNYLIKNIFNLTGICISILDTDYKVLTNCSAEFNFCDLLQKSKKEHKNCKNCDEKILKKCSQSKKLESHICRVGLYDAAMPIIKNNHIVGYIIMGRIRSIDSPQELTYCPDTNLNYDHLNSLYNKLPFFKDEQLSALYNIFSCIFFNEAINIIYDTFMNTAIQFINDNLKEPLSINILCKNLNVSANYLYDAFHKNLNCTVNNYITGQRIKHAKRLLIETDFPICRVAEEVGISNYTYFFRLFKKMNGISPNEYRKASRK